MKDQMSGFDIRAAVSELGFLRGSFMDNLYQTRKDEVIFKFKVPKDNAASYGPFADIIEAGTGKYLTCELTVRAGHYLHLNSAPVEKPMAPSPLIMKFRKQLSNAFVTGVTQPGFERIVHLEMEKTMGYTVVLEMFGDGNIVMVQEGKILIPMRSQKWKGRALKSGEEYLPPPAPADPFAMDREDLEKVLNSSDRDLVRCLAVEANLSGPYAEEVIRRAGLDKSAKAADLDGDGLENIAEGFFALLEDFSRSPGGIGRLDEDGDLAEVVPDGIFDLTGEDLKKFSAFNMAVEAMAQSSTEEEDDVAGQARLSRLGKVRRQADQQREAVEKYKMKSVEMKRKGDALYANYGRCEDVLRSVLEAKERLGWDEVAKRLAASDEGVVVVPEKGKVRLTVEDPDGPVELELDVRLDMNANANTMYESGKKARSRSRGAAKALASTTAKLEKMEAAHTVAVRAAEGPDDPIYTAGGDGGTTEGEPGARPDGGLAPPPKRRARRRFWFEDYRWFISSEGFVAAGGKDAGSNDKVVKKYLQDLDRYAHADVHGAASVVVKAMGGKAPGEDTMEEACAFAVIHSRAWEQGTGGGDSYWVNPEQVSKTPQAGETMPRGAFIIRGKRNWQRDLPLLVAVAEVEFEGVRMVMGAPQMVMERMAKKTGEKMKYVVLAPGPIDKDRVTKVLASAFQVTVEEVAGVLPSGGVQLVDAVGLPGAVADALMEN